MPCSVPEAGIHPRCRSSHARNATHESEGLGIILDTNAVSALLKGEPALEALLARNVRHELPVIVIGEDSYGLVHSRLRWPLLPCSTSSFANRRCSRSGSRSPQPMLPCARRFVRGARRSRRTMCGSARSPSSTAWTSCPATAISTRAKGDLGRKLPEQGVGIGEDLEVHGRFSRANPAQSSRRASSISSAEGAGPRSRRRPRTGRITGPGTASAAVVGGPALGWLSSSERIISSSFFRWARDSRRIPGG
jgi:hypothetical protein